MVGFEDDADASRREVVLEPVGDLFGEPLLDLKVSGEEFDDPRQFGQAQDAFRGDVANVRDTVERHEVVFAERVERDVAGEDELVVALVVREGREVERLGRQELSEGAGDAPTVQAA